MRTKVKNLEKLDCLDSSSNDFFCVFLTQSNELVEAKLAINDTTSNSLNVNETYRYNQYKDFKIYNLTIGTKFIVAAAYSNDLQLDALLVYQRIEAGGSQWLYGGVNGTSAGLGNAKIMAVQQAEYNGLNRIFAQEMPATSLKVYEIGQTQIDLQTTSNNIIDNAFLEFEGSENNKRIPLNRLLYNNYPEGQVPQEEDSSLLWLWILLAILAIICLLLLLLLIVLILLANKKKKQPYGGRSRVYEDDDYDYERHEFRSEKRISQVR